MPLIKLDDIAIINRQRKFLDPAKVQDLADSIRANGLLHPIVVRRPLPHEEAAAAGKPYVLAVGGRRTAAHMVLGRTEIEANLKEDIVDPLQAQIVELEENVRRENITWEEETNARATLAALYKELHPDEGIREIAERVGVSHGQLSKDINLHKLMKDDPTLKAANSKGSALRNATFKQVISQRVEQAKQNTDNHVSVLQSKLIIADGVEFARALPSQSIDLVFSDLPYGIDYYEVQSGGTEASKGHYDDGADKSKAFIAAVVPECLRVLKPTGWAVFFMCYEWHGWLQSLIEQVETPTQKLFAPEMPPWIWTRRGRGNHGHWPELHASNRYEMIVVVNGGEAKLTKKPVENVLDFPPFSGERLHAMQKPHELCREIIDRTTVVGERVLDVCFGSGAHLAAAASMGRDFIGCDSNPANLPGALSLVGQHYSHAAASALARAAQPVKVGP